jgi:hypothetical protein
MRGNFACPLNAPKKFALLSSSLNIIRDPIRCRPIIRGTHCRIQACLSGETSHNRTSGSFRELHVCESEFAGGLVQTFEVASLPKQSNDEEQILFVAQGDHGIDAGGAARGE